MRSKIVALRAREAANFRRPRRPTGASVEHRCSTWSALRARGYQVPTAEHFSETRASNLKEKNLRYIYAAQKKKIALRSHPKVLPPEYVREKPPHHIYSRPSQSGPEESENHPHLRFVRLTAENHLCMHLHTLTHTHIMGESVQITHSAYCTFHPQKQATISRARGGNSSLPSRLN